MNSKFLPLLSGILLCLIVWQTLIVGAQKRLLQSDSIDSQVGNSISGKSAPQMTSKSPRSTPTPLPLPKLKLGIPVRGTLLGNPPRSIQTGVFSGKLVYTFNDWKSSVFHHYLVLHSVSGGNSSGSGAFGKGVDANNLPIAFTYPIVSLEGPNNDDSFDPQFSPDGNQVLVKLGAPNAPHSSYWLYVWDLKTNQFKLVTSRKLFFRLTWWSPDSNYVAFVAGGDVEGETSLLGQPLPPLRLLACNWRSGVEHLITHDKFNPFAVAWRAPHTLLYTALPLSPPTREGKAKAHLKATIRPNIYAVSAEGGTPELFIQDAQSPTVSPNGEWIVFFGSAVPEHPYPLDDDWWFRPGGASMSIIKADGTKRQAFGMESHSYPSIIWEPDNRHFLSFKQTQDSPNSRAEVKEWNIDNGQWRLIKELKAHDFQFMDRMFIQPQFRALGLSKNGKAFLASIEECTGQTGPDLDITNTLQAIDLHNGLTSTLAQTNNWAGWDWFDMTK